MLSFPHFWQEQATDCGATCLRMVAKFHGRNYPSLMLYNYCNTGSQGASILDLNRAADTIGFRVSTVKLSCEQLANNAPLPAILHWRAQHFIVLYDVHKKDGLTYFIIADPALPHLVGYPSSMLEKFWISNDCKNEAAAYGIALLLEPTEKFYTIGQLFQIDRTTL